MNPDAEAVPDEIFLAVHKEFDLRVSAPADSPSRRMSPREFLDAFLDPHRTHVQAAVLGESGSGKSHFIQWMRINIPAAQDTFVLTIPKARTSLKSILQNIIYMLPPDRQHRYQEELDHSAQYIITPDGQRKHLLGQIALAIGEDNPQDPGNELEAELIKELPNLFYDPHIRNRFLLRSGGIIDELANHIFAEPHGYHPAESRRQFSADDLPPPGGRAYVDASKEARNVLDILMEDQSTTIPLALDIINRNLNTAITLTLSLTGDSLIDLMAEIRRYLKAEGKSLILLIEDFARLQGIDRALLQALITPASQGEEQLCMLRWAMAVTTGYYEKTADTVQTRMDFIVDMDLPGREGSGGFVGKQGLASFAAGYLNAARVGSQGLKTWYETRSQGADSLATVPNRCNDCSNREPCHSSFGEVEGTGLYPFTYNALWNMARRADESLEDKFNPRRFIKSVLIKALDTYGEHLENGQYPPRLLLNDLGGIKAILPQREQQLRNLDPANFDRRITLLELWDGSGDLVNLHEVIHRAFDVPLINDLGMRQSGEEGVPPVPPPLPEPEADFRLQGRLDAIQEWARGGELPQALASELRELLYSTIETFIDWDAAGFEKSAFATKTGNKPFRQRNINFVRQQTHVPPSLVQLLLPIDPDDDTEFNSTAIAFQGLIQFDKHKHWGFEGGQTALLNLLECLEHWSSAILLQIRTLAAQTETWNLIAATLELLATGSVLSGKITRSQITATDLLNASFQNWPEPNDTSLHSPELKNIYSKIWQQREKLVTMIRAWCSGTKGGRKGAYINSRELLPVITRLQKKWILSQTPPEEDPESKDYQDIVKLYREIFSKLREAATAERSARLDWLDMVEKHVAEGEKRSDIIEILRQHIEKVSKTGLPVRQQLVRGLNEALDRFQNVQFDDAVRVFKGLRDEEDALASLAQYAKGKSNAVNVARELFEMTDRFLDEVEARVRSVRDEIEGAAGPKFKENLDRIGSAFSRLHSELTSLEEHDAD